MSITGNLQTMQLAELLQWLSQGRKTGTLVIDDGRVEKRIYFRDGHVISSASTDPREYLGQFLVARGHITPEQLTEAIGMQERSGMLLGKILVSSGALAEADLQPLLERKAREAIYDIFTWPAGSFEFLDDELPERLMIPTDLDVTGIVLEGVRRLDEWERIRGVIPTLEAVPVTVADLGRAKLADADRRLLELVDDRSTLEQIRDRAGVTDFRVCEAVFAAAQRGLVKVVVPPWTAAGAASRNGGGPGRVASGDVDAAQLLAAAAPHLEAARYEEALRRLRAAQALEPGNREVTAAVEAAEARIHEVLDRAGVTPAAIPRLATPLEELTASKISRHEGFLLSRVTGTYDIASIVKISSLPALDARLVFWRLVQAGHLTLEARR